MSDLQIRMLHRAVVLDTTPENVNAWVRALRRVGKKPVVKIGSKYLNFRQLNIRICFSGIYYVSDYSQIPTWRCLHSHKNKKQAIKCAKRRMWVRVLNDSDVIVKHINLN